TGIAPLIGARLTGLLSPFPLYTAILAVFAQRSAGAYPAIKVVRGLLYGLFGFAACFFLLATLLVPLGLAGAFVIGLLAVLAFQGVSLWLLRRT
ncbi:MAG TPA: hypothetical protein VHD90_09110, partial [Phototrophicaceae bacterium]|nr:hypothetical protein [Phototrophicaceae bacterium]